MRAASLWDLGLIGCAGGTTARFFQFFLSNSEGRFPQTIEKPLSLSHLLATIP